MNAIVEQITKRFEFDQANPRPARTAFDVPASYDAFTTEWLTATLCSRAPGAKVTSFRFDGRNDGTTNRRRIFLEYNDAGVSAGLPKSVFLKATLDLSNRITLGSCGAARAETAFYTHVRSLLSIEAPRAYHAYFDPESYAYIILFHDMEPSGAAFCDEATPMDRGRAEQQVTLLADLHGTFYERTDLFVSRLPLVNWPDWWANLQSMNYAHACKQGVEAAEQVFPARLFKRRAEIWPATTASVEQHRKLPRTVAHSDVHLKNWYLTGDGRMGLGDWQSCCIAHWGRDLVYAISTALTPENRSAWERDLIALYLDRMAARGVPRMRFDDAFTIYRQQTFSALAYWTSTLCPPEDWADMQPSDTTISFIRRMAVAIDDLDCLDSFKK